MIGTITNTCTIIVGSVVGAMLKRGIKPEWQKVLFTAMGLASLALGFNAVCLNMPKSQYPVLFILSLSIGGLIGTMLDLDGRFKRLVDRLSRKSDERDDVPTTDKHPDLATGLATGVLLYCIGTLSIVGPINSALLGDNTFLFTNATLDLVTSAVLAATYGIGMVLAAPVLFCWQGMFYGITLLSSSAISNQLMAELLIVGGLLITGSGLALLNIKNVKTLNFLPALLVPVAWFLIKSLF